METAALLAHRKEKDAIFAGHHSPLDHYGRNLFAGLDYYEPNPALVFRVPVGPADRARIGVETSDGNTQIHERAGVAHIEVDGTGIEITLYDTGHPGYFVPFRDATSGNETYGAGRYLDVDPNPDGSVTLDFNFAYNPLCAYNDAYSCPLPPVENWLSVPIRAGERAYAR